jgi:hypothetical protein
MRKRENAKRLWLVVRTTVDSWISSKKSLWQAIAVWWAAL